MIDFLIPVTVNVLPSIDTLHGRQGMFILPDGSININTKSGTWFTINKRSDHRGVIKTDTVITPVQGEGIWFWASEGVYPNAGNVSIAKYGIVSFNGNTWASMEVELPESKAFIPAFSTMPFPLSGDVQVTDNDRFWQLIEGKTALASDIPSDDSLIWENLGGADFTAEQFNEQAKKSNIELLSTDLEDIDFQITIPQNSNVGGIYTHITSSDIQLGKIRVKVANGGYGNFICKRGNNIIEIKNNVPLNIGWNDVSIDFESKKGDWIGYDTTASTAFIYIIYTNGSAYYYDNGYRDGNISIEVYSYRDTFNTFFDVITSEIKEVGNIKNKLSSFWDGYEISEYKGLNFNSLWEDVRPNKAILVSGGLEESASNYYVGVNTEGLNTLRYMGLGTIVESPRDKVYATVAGFKNGVYTTLYPAYVNYAILDIEVDVSEYDEIGISFEASLGYPKAELYNKTKIPEGKDSVRNYIDKKFNSLGYAGGEALITLEKPNYVPIVNLIGTLPIDITSTVDMTLEFRQGNSVIFNCPITNKVQGSSTVYHPKKNWNIKLQNYRGDKLKLKFGNWFADTAFHLKANFNDRTSLRDLTANNIINNILKSRPYPESDQKSTFADYAVVDNVASNLMTDSAFCIDGFPVEVRINNEFYGIYIWRQRRENELYRVVNTNKKNIYLANSNYDSIGLARDFNPAQWELKSPKISGYVENGAITDTAVLADITRLFDWFKGVANGTVNFESTADNYIVKNNIVDVIIGLQTTQNWDYYANNFNLVTHDGNIWRFFVHDCDWSMGIINVNSRNVGIESEVKKLYWSGHFMGDDYFKNILYPKLFNLIKIRYTELRNKGIISLDAFFPMLQELSAKIGQKRYADDLKRWESEGMHNDKGVHSMAYLMQFFKWKLEYLDSIWKL